MAIFYHGTPVRNAEAILTNGFGAEHYVWECSVLSNTYMWHENLCDDRYYNGEGVSRAFDSALMACAVLGVQEKDVVVFKITVPDKCVGDGKRVCMDSSCQNMDGAFEAANGWLNSLISSGEISVVPRIYKDVYNPSFRWFYLTNVSEKLLKLTEKEHEELKMAKKIETGSEDCYEELFGTPFCFSECGEPLVACTTGLGELKQRYKGEVKSEKLEKAVC